LDGKSDYQLPMTRLHFITAFSSIASRLRHNHTEYVVLLTILPVLQLLLVVTFDFSSYFSSSYVLRPNSITLSGRKHVRSWSQTGSKLAADLQRAGIWPVV